LNTVEKNLKKIFCLLDCRNTFIFEDSKIWEDLGVVESTFTDSTFGEIHEEKVLANFAGPPPSGG
jgi:hypothetical protein